MELALVLDNTGSMWGSPFDTMKAAAHELVNIIYGEAETHPNLYVAVVPYVATVNIGSARTSWLEFDRPGADRQPVLAVDLEGLRAGPHQRLRRDRRPALGEEVPQLPLSGRDRQ